MTQLKRNYKAFGKLQINELELHSKNKLMVSYLSKSPIMDKELKTQIISEDLSSIIIGILDTLPNNEIDIRKVNRLSEKERNIFNKLIFRSGLSKDLKYKQKPRTIQDMVERFEILQGSLEAGNDSPEVIKEAIDLIKLLNTAGKINSEDALELIKSIE